MELKLVEVYRAFNYVDEKGETWYRGLYDLSFSSPAKGWVIGSGQVLMTEDGGATWKNLFSENKNLPYSHAHRIFSVNAEECWIPSFHKHECCFTKDGGKTWQIKPVADNIYVADVFFLNSRFGCILGNDGSHGINKGEIYLTSDKGKNWENISLKILGKPSKIVFVDEENGWFLTDYLPSSKSNIETCLYHSQNGGKNWIKIQHFEKQILDFHIFNQKEILFVGEDGFLFTSKNTTKKSVEHVAINSVSFIDKTGIAAGDEGNIFCTKDAGANWINIKNSHLENFVAVQFTEVGRGVLASDKAVYIFHLQ